MIKVLYTETLYDKVGQDFIPFTRIYVEEDGVKAIKDFTKTRKPYTPIGEIMSARPRKIKEKQQEQTNNET